MPAKKTAKVDSNLRLLALQMATSPVFKREYHSGYDQMGGSRSPSVHQSMTDDEALVRAKKFLAWMTE